MSTDVERRRVYAHTGWRKIDDAWYFLHAGGAIGPIGPQPYIDVALDKKPTQAALPPPPDGAALRDAVCKSLALLDLAPDTITAPLLGGVYRAPLCQVVAMDAALHLHGTSGTFKTELAALAQAHFGAFDRLTLPGAWASTANALELLAFLAKDIVCVIDDFAPTGGAQDVAHYHATGERVLRAVGNQAGRARMSADGSLRPQYAPRGVVLSTGEDVPKGHSVGARVLVVDVAPGDVDRTKLAAAQHEAAEGTYAAAMAGYAKWLAGRFERLYDELPRCFVMLRDAAARRGLHARLPATQAHLLLGWQTWLDFAQECGAVTREEAERYLERARTALVQLAASTQEKLAAQEPAQRFMELLASVLSTGKAHLTTKDGAVPPDPQRWGWRQRAGDDQMWEPVARQQIGWIDGDDVYLDPDAAYAAARRLAQDQGEGFPLQPRTLWKRLHDQGRLASWDEARGRHLVRHTIGASRLAVLHLNVSTLESTMLNKSAHSETNDAGAGAQRASFGPIGPIIGPIGQQSAHKTAHAPALHALARAHQAPDGPIGPIISAIVPPKAQRKEPAQTVRGVCSDCPRPIAQPYGRCEECRARAYAALDLDDSEEV